MELAAIQIQSAYRGHRARREIASAEMETNTSDLTTNPDEVQGESDQLDSTNELLEEETVSEKEPNVTEEESTNQQTEEEQSLDVVEETNASDETKAEELNEETSDPTVLEEVPVQDAEGQMDTAKDENVENATDEPIGLTDNGESELVDSFEKIEDIVERDNNEINSPREDMAENVPPEEIAPNQEDNQDGDGDGDGELSLEDEPKNNDSCVVDEVGQENEYIADSNIYEDGNSLATENDTLTNEDEKEDVIETSENEIVTDDIKEVALEEGVIESESAEHNEEESEMALGTEEGVNQEEEIKLENEEPIAAQENEVANEIDDSGASTQLAEEQVIIENDDANPLVEEKDTEEDVALAQDSSDQTEGQEDPNNLVEANEGENENEEGSILQEKELVQISDSQEVEGLDPSANAENETVEENTEDNENDQATSTTLLEDEAVEFITSDDAALNEEETDGIDNSNPSEDMEGLQVEISEEVNTENDKEGNIDPEIEESILKATEVTEDESIPAEESQTSPSMNDVVDESVSNIEQPLESATMDLKQTDENINLDFDEILEEGDQEISNDDEEEIWRKLQKDIQLEEEEQKNLAAIRIQSSYRGYKTRKDLNRELDEDKNGDEGNQDDEGNQENDVEGDSSEEKVVENGNDGGITEALAGLTEAIASVALIMTDTTNQPNVTLLSADNKDDLLLTAEAVNEIQDDEDGGNLAQELLATANPNEVNDVKEEPLSNGESIDDVQLIKSYVIKTGMSEDRYHPLESTIDENCPEEEANSESPKPTDAAASNKEDDDINVVPDPEGVFELYVKSDETINDGLLDSSWVEQPHQENMSTISHLVEGSKEENEAAIKIQAGYRGHLERRRYENAKRVDIEQKSNDEEELDESSQATNQNLDFLEQENSAATKIQAGYRGNRDRRRAKDLKNNRVDDQLNFSEDQFNLDESVQKEDFNSTELENEAATKIQAGYRGHRDRKRVNDLKDQHNENKSYIRSDKVDMADGECDKSVDETTLECQNAAATKIQAGYRGNRDRKRINDLKNSNNEGTGLVEELSEYHLEETEQMTNRLLTPLDERENSAATKIQAGYRGHRDRKRIKGLKDHHNECEASKEEFELDESDETIDEQERKNAAATKIQAGYRGHRDRKRINELKDHQNECEASKEEFELDESDETVDEQERKNAAATKIQAGYRGHRDRKRINELKDHHNECDTNKEELLEKEKQFDMDESFETFDEQERENAAATKIQAGYRGNRDRKKTKELKDSHFVNEPVIKTEAELTVEEYSEQERENAAATKIQAGYRGHRDRKRVNDLRDHQNECEISKEEIEFSESDETVDEQERKNAVATKIQAGYRGHRDRKRINELKDHHNECEEEFELNEPGEPVDEQELENAATIIQAGYRGHRDRKRVKELKDLDSGNIANTRETELVEVHSFQLGIQGSEENTDEAERENAAATKIQAGYRGHLDRKRISGVKDMDNGNKSTKIDKAKLTKDSLLSSFEETDAFERENAAATKIQAGYRGHRDRKRIHDLKDQFPEHESLDIDNALYEEQDKVQQDIENKAATAIQSGYRGYRTRKNMKTDTLPNISGMKM